MQETDATTAWRSTEVHRRREWVVFSCAFPSTRSTPRVAVWRRLRRFGAVPLKSGLYVLPATAECIEAMQWLAQEARAEGADPIVIRAEIIEGLSEPQLIELFHDARGEDYAAIEARAGEIGRQVREAGADLSGVRATLERLRADYQQVRRIDYFDAPAGGRAGEQIEVVADVLAAAGQLEPEVPSAVRSEYLGRVWVTRPRPFIDRLACAWLIRRFIDPSGEVRYADAPAAGEVAFDMEPGLFTHIGNRCTFEVMIAAFGLDDPALDSIGEVVHEIDLRDGRYAHPETHGLEAILNGWHAARWDDDALEESGLHLFDGLYARFRDGAQP